MTVTIKITGSIEKEYHYDEFPTDDELGRLGFKKNYRTLRTFRTRLESVMRRSKSNRNQGTIEWQAVLRKGIPTIAVK